MRAQGRVTQTATRTTSWRHRVLLDDGRVVWLLDHQVVPSAKPLRKDDRGELEHDLIGQGWRWVQTHH